MILVHTVGHFAYMGVWRHLTAPDFDVNDFKAYYTAALAVRTGQAADYLYSDPARLNLGLLPPQPWVDFAVARGIPHPSAYIYPPFLAVALAPLTLLPYHAANLLWFALNTLMLAGSVGLLIALGGRLRGRPALQDPLAAACVLFVCLNFFPTIRAMQCGQVGLVLLLLTVLALWGVLGGRDRLAGLCLAVAAAIKLTPIVLILYLAWMGRRRAALWGAGVFAGLTAASIVVTGWSGLSLYVTEFLPALSRGAATYANQSVNGFLNRVLTGQSMAVFDFSSEPALVRALTRAAAAVLLAASFVVAGAAPRRRGHAPAVPAVAGEPGGRLALGYGLVTLASVLVSPISWEHHYVLALLPLTLMIHRAAGVRAVAPVALLAAAYVLMAIDVFDPIRRNLPYGPGRIATSYVLAGGLLLWGLAAHALWRRPVAA